MSVLKYIRSRSLAQVDLGSGMELHVTAWVAPKTEATDEPYALEAQDVSPTDAALKPLADLITKSVEAWVAGRDVH